MKMKLAVFALSVTPIFAQSRGATMKAIVAHQWGGAEALKLEDVAIPTPKENEMLIKVFGSGVNSFDGMLLTGKYAKIFGTQLLSGFYRSSD